MIKVKILNKFINKKKESITQNFEKTINLFNQEIQEYKKLKKRL